MDRGGPVHPRGGPQLLAVLRILTGCTFLWAFVDKMFGLGYTTGAAKAWVNGDSPTKGFLGIGMRVAAVAGAVLLMSMWGRLVADGGAERGR